MPDCAFLKTLPQKIHRTSNYINLMHRIKESKDTKQLFWQECTDEQTCLSLLFADTLRLLAVMADLNLYLPTFHMSAALHMIPQQCHVNP